MAKEIYFEMEIAGVKIGVSARLNSTKDFCADFIIPESQAPDIKIEIGDEAVQFVRDDALVHENETGVPHVEISDASAENLALHKLLSDQMPKYGKVLFHSSAITFDGEAVLFTARSGTGKSTHTNLWKKVYGERVDYVNDDKPYIGVDEPGDEVLKVYGSPWNGKHGRGKNTVAPIKAICIIKRSPDNRIEKMNPLEVFATLFSQSYRPKDAQRLTDVMAVLKRIAEEIPIYTVHCNMDDEAAIVAHDGIFGE